MSISTLRGKDNFDTSLVPRFSNFAQFQHREPSGTSGGNSVATAFNLRPINYTVYNTISGASLSSNIITLPAGKYYSEVWSMTYAILHHSVFLKNNSLSEYILIGSSERSNNSGNGCSTKSVASGAFTLNSVTNIQVQHYTEAGRSPNGLGTTVNSGQDDIYADIKIWKLEDAV